MATVEFYRERAAQAQAEAEAAIRDDPPPDAITPSSDIAVAITPGCSSA